MKRKWWIRGGIGAVVMVCLVGGLFAVQIWRSYSQVDGATKRELRVDGRDRTFWVYQPAGLPPEGLHPAVIVLHGGGGNAANAANMSGMSAVADAEGFLVVYPNGNGRILSDRLLTWNAGNCCGYADDQDVDDVAFISAMIDTLITDYNADPDAIFVTGMSNGGMMSHRVGCELSDKVTAIAPVAGALNVDCAPTAPVGVLIIHGTDDQHVLYEGGKPIVTVTDEVGDRVDTGVLEGAAQWATFNGCAPDPVASDYNADVSLLTYDQCRGASVVVVTIEGGQHSWPGGQSWWRGDEVYQDYDASREMWAYFETFLGPNTTTE